PRGQLLPRSEHVLGLRVAPQSDDRRVLEQQKDIADLPALAQLHQRLLQLERRRVVDSAELEDRDHALIATPYTLFMASSMASASVGCAWMVNIRSSAVASSSMAATASEISSVADGPMMCTPRISPYCASDTTLMKPSCEPTMEALE